MSWGHDARAATGFSQQALARAFDRVRDPRDWKAPIRAEIPAEMQALVARAVFWFTATELQFVPTQQAGRLLATAPGYLKGPWGQPDQPAPAESDLAERGRPGPGPEALAVPAINTCDCPNEVDDPWGFRGPAVGK